MNYILNHKLRILGILVLTVLLGVGVYLALNPTVFRSRASGAKLILEANGSSTVTQKAGVNMPVKVFLNPGGESVVGVDLVIEYDPNVFIVADNTITTVSASGFGVFPVAKKEGNNKIVISGLSISADKQSLGTPISGNAPVLIATIDFFPNVTAASSGNKNTTISFASDSVIASSTANNLFDPNNQQNLNVTLTPGISGPVNLRQSTCAYPNVAIVWNTPPEMIGRNVQYTYTYNGRTSTPDSNESANIDLSNGPNENVSVSVQAVGGGASNVTINCPKTQTAAATPVPVPSLTSSSTSPYTCSVSSAYITDPSTGAEVTSIAAGAPYNMYVKFNVGGTNNSGDLAFTQYQAIFDNADRINVPGQCFWSSSSNQYTCAWENVLTAGSVGDHNMRFFVREVGVETAQCNLNGNPVLIRYTSN